MLAEELLKNRVLSFVCEKSCEPDASPGECAGSGESWRAGKRHIRRLRRNAGLRVPPTKRKIIRRGVSTGLPAIATHRNQVWTWDFIAKIVQRWLQANRIKTIYIEPGSPWQNGFMESFHGRFRDECLNREQLWTLTEARLVLTSGRDAPK